MWKTELNSLFKNGIKSAVTCLIKATIKHTIPPAHEIPAVLSSAIVGDFLDLDLAVLASPAEEYEGYSKQIRQEYIHVSAEDYRNGRTKVLHNFIGRQRLFFGENQEMNEAQARSNLAAEIKRLKNQENQKSLISSTLNSI
jgi:predicted metal-dependent HD superfamily phosphohydrolase